MDWISIIRDLLIPLSAVGSLLSVAIGSLLALKQYRLKLEAETRLKETARIESNLQLLRVFTEIMNIAHARVAYYSSEKAIEAILKPENVASLLHDRAKLSQTIQACIVPLPVGAAAQSASIAAIAALGQRHEILTNVAIEGLKSLTKVGIEVPEEYLKALNEKAARIVQE